MSCFANRERILVPLAGRGGEGRNCCCYLVGWLMMHLGAPYAVVLYAAAIYGHMAGRFSTSTSEAISIRSQCSAARRFQVVRPRKRHVCWCLRSIAGKESPSIMCSNDLGGDAWRSPSICGGDALGSECSSSSCSRVFFVKARSFFFEF